MPRVVHLSSGCKIGDKRDYIRGPTCEYGQACSKVRMFFFNIKFETKGHRRQMTQYQIRSWRQSYDGYPRIAPQSGVCRAHPQLPNLRYIYIYIYTVYMQNIEYTILQYIIIIQQIYKHVFEIVDGKILQ